MVIEKPQDLLQRPHDLVGSWFLVTILGCDFSNQALGDGFREGKTRKNRGSEPSSLFFSPLLSEPRILISTRRLGFPQEPAMLRIGLGM